MSVQISGNDKDCHNDYNITKQIIMISKTAFCSRQWHEIFQSVEQWNLSVLTLQNQHSSSIDKDSEPVTEILPIIILRH